MSYRTYGLPSPELMGYDPFCDLPRDHLARLAEAAEKNEPRGKFINNVPPASIRSAKRRSVF